MAVCLCNRKVNRGMEQKKKKKDKRAVDEDPIKVLASPESTLGQLTMHLCFGLMPTPMTWPAYSWSVHGVVEIPAKIWKVHCKPLQPVCFFWLLQGRHRKLMYP